MIERSTCLLSDAHTRMNNNVFACKCHTHSLTHSTHSLPLFVLACALHGVRTISVWEKALIERICVFVGTNATILCQNRRIRAHLWSGRNKYLPRSQNESE